MCIEVTTPQGTVRSEPGGGCTDDPPTVWIRASSNRYKELGFTPEEWQAFVAEVKAGRYDGLVT